MLSKEKIEEAKEDLNFFHEGGWITHHVAESANAIEKYIELLEKENNKLNEMIDEMAIYINNFDTDEDICKKIRNPPCYDETNLDCCVECIKSFFEEKVEEK